jgi:protein ImuB
MTRVASLFLPQLAIERLRRLERPATPPDRPVPDMASLRPLPIDDQPGACSVPRGGGWRPGARWAHTHGTGTPSPTDIDALPAHQRPTMREMGRRSEPAVVPFRSETPQAARAGSSALPSWSSWWGRPTIVIARRGQSEWVTAACPIARDQGLRPGMAAAHARALVSDLDVHEAQPEEDRTFLERLALHAVARWTPTASLCEPDGLWLDLSGTTHLFGGETRFCERLLGFLQRLGLSATIAIAGTPGAAHALARFGGQSLTILAPGTETQAIADLPLAALRLAPQALVAAARFGLDRIGDLYAMPRAPLAKRLGLSTVERLDQARGIVAEPIIPILPFDRPQVERRLVEPIATPEAIAQVIGDLIDDVVVLLRTRGLGVRMAVLSCHIVDGAQQQIAIGTARATREARHLKRLFAMRIERIAPGLGIETMVLAIPRVDLLLPEVIKSDILSNDSTPDIAPLVDQLCGRVGAEALFRIGAVESDVPERAVRRQVALATPVGWPAWPRPVRLLTQPELLHNVVALLPDHPPRRFGWRGKAYRVVAGDGPERVHGEWWRRPGELWAVRDYFRVETQNGERFWIFRRGDGVDEPTGDLSWLLHGLFG